MNKLGPSLTRLGSAIKKTGTFEGLSFKGNFPLIGQPRLYFSSCGSGNLTSISKQNIQIKPEQVQIGDERVETFRTKGAISILSQLKGTNQAQNGELYALMFTCGKCKTKSVRSFTKNAYHKGVVLIKCEGCHRVQLVADNLGWFDENPTNIQSLGGNVTKVHDPVAIVRFLNAALQLKEETEKSEPDLK